MPASLAVLVKSESPELKFAREKEAKFKSSLSRFSSLKMSLRPLLSRLSPKVKRSESPEVKRETFGVAKEARSETFGKERATWIKGVRYSKES